MKRLVLVVAAILAAGVPGRVRADGVKRLTLDEAVRLASRLDPGVAEASIGRERSQIALLRAKLDRISVKIDAQTQELWNQSNIGGARLLYCTTSNGPIQTDAATCTELGGQLNASQTQTPTYFQALANASASVTIPVVTGGYLSANIARADMLDRAGAVNVRQSWRDSALAVARTYWEIRRLSLSQESLVRALERLSDAEKVIAARVRNGLAPAIDLNRATVRRLQQLARVNDLAGQAAESEAQFAVLLGLSGNVTLIDSPKLPDREPGLSRDEVDMALKLRPEVTAATFQLSAQHEAVRLARSTYYPQISAFGLFQYGNNPYLTGTGAHATTAGSNPFSTLAGSLTLGLTASINIFDTFKTYTSVKDARLVERRLAEEKRDAERTVTINVRQTEATVSHLRHQRAPLVAARELAEDNLAILQRQYQDGNALVIDLLDAEVDLANVEVQLTDVTARLQMAWIEYHAAVTGEVTGDVQ